MSLDQTSLAIGRLQAAQESTADAVDDVKQEVSQINDKLDRLLAREPKVKLSLKQWLTLIAASSATGGAAHALGKFLE